MPTLQFKGKNIIWNHHLSIPYHTLDEVSKLHFQSDKANDNLIIEGDNLLALKALLPMYTGKIKCICIDPPYNTGTDKGKWVYNDNVNSPLIKEWLGKEVGADDLTRHDKWLCMMTPRLRLLNELLSPEGVIFINIEDNEAHHLRILLDEIFREENFVCEFVWEKKKKPSFLHKNIGKLTEYVICYVRDTNRTFPFSIETTTEGKKYPLNNAGNSLATLILPPNTVRFGIDDQVVKAQDMSEGSIITRLLKDVTIKDGLNANELVIEGEWRYSQDKVNEIIEDEDEIFIAKTPFRPNHIKPGGEIKKMKNVFSPHHYEMETNEDATAQLIELFGREVFDNPKPVKLIRTLIQAVTYDDKKAIVLDSFSGSGTTGHALMDLNKEDGGTRKFILVQMTEATEKEPDKNICKDITRERIKRAIEKYGYDSGFKYLKVGQPLDAETLLEGKLPEYKVFAKYVYYLCTGENLKEEKKINEKKFFVGTFGKQAVCLIYTQDYEALTRMALNLEAAEKIIADQPDKKRIVYAPACFLDEEYMEAHQIEFVSIPYNLFQRKGA